MPPRRPLLSIEEICSIVKRSTKMLAKEDHERLRGHLEKPKPEIVQELYRAFVCECLHLAPEDLKQMRPSAVRYPDLLERCGGVARLHLLIFAKILCQIVGIDDFVLEDMGKPDPQRTHRIFSEICRFIRHSEGRAQLRVQLEEEQQRLVEEERKERRLLEDAKAKREREELKMREKLEGAEERQREVLAMRQELKRKAEREEGAARDIDLLKSQIGMLERELNAVSEENERLMSKMFAPDVTPDQLIEEHALLTASFQNKAAELEEAQDTKTALRSRRLLLEKAATKLKRRADMTREVTAGVIRLNESQKNVKKVQQEIADVTRRLSSIKGERDVNEDKLKVEEQRKRKCDEGLALRKKKATEEIEKRKAVLGPRLSELLCLRRATAELNDRLTSLRAATSEARVRSDAHINAAASFAKQCEEAAQEDCRRGQQLIDALLHRQRTEVPTLAALASLFPDHVVNEGAEASQQAHASQKRFHGPSVRVSRVSSRLRTARLLGKEEREGGAHRGVAQQQQQQRDRERARPRPLLIPTERVPHQQQQGRTRLMGGTVRGDPETQQHATAARPGAPATVREKAKEKENVGVRLKKEEGRERDVDGGVSVHQQKEKEREGKQKPQGHSSSVPSQGQGQASSKQLLGGGSHLLATRQTKTNLTRVPAGRQDPSATLLSPQKDEQGNFFESPPQTTGPCLPGAAAEGKKETVTPLNTQIPKKRSPLTRAQKARQQTLPDPTPVPSNENNSLPNSATSAKAPLSSPPKGPQHLGRTPQFGINTQQHDKENTQAANAHTQLAGMFAGLSLEEGTDECGETDEEKYSRGVSGAADVMTGPVFLLPADSALLKPTPGGKHWRTVEEGERDRGEGASTAPVGSLGEEP